jgi:hypothetical protein
MTAMTRDVGDVGDLSIQLALYISRDRYYNSGN